ncbi:MAG: hypothetical protein WA415_05385, partial [Mycobacterium sp.]
MLLVEQRDNRRSVAGLGQCERGSQTTVACDGTGEFFQRRFRLIKTDFKRTVIDHISPQIGLPLSGRPPGTLQLDGDLLD